MGVMGVTAARAGALALLCAVPLTATLAACGAQQDLWQVVAVYTDPAEPGEVPADAAGLANFTLPESGGSGELTGTTGCATLEAQTTLEDDRLRIDTVEVADPGDCTGGPRYLHDQLAELFAPGAEFDVTHLSEMETLLTARDAGVDPPSVRLMLL